MNIQSITIFSEFAPAVTPRAVVGRLNTEMVQFISACLLLAAAGIKSE